MFAPMRPTPTKPIRSVITTLSFCMDFGLYLFALEFRKKWVVRFFFAHVGERPMPRAQDCLVWQGEDLFSVILQRIRVRNGAAAHRTRKNRVTHYGDGFLKSGDNVGDPTDRMPGGLARLDFE